LKSPDGPTGEGETHPSSGNSSPNITLDVCDCRQMVASVWHPSGGAIKGTLDDVSVVELLHVDLRMEVQ
jgi:hypothetical protein